MKTVEIYNESGHLLPAYETEHSAGVDLRAYLPNLPEEAFVIPPNFSAVIGTGLYMAIPDGYELQIRPRSGLAANKIVTVLNTPGTIDGDYRGEIKVILINHGNAPFPVQNGDRIAQGVLAKYEKIKWKTVSSQEELGDTERGTAGLGSTGV